MKMKTIIYILNINLFSKLYMKLPLPFSKWIYAFIKKYVFEDSRSIYFDLVFKQIKSRRINGDYLEFGVYKGSSFILAYKAAKKYGLNNMRFFAFDSFEGLPDNESVVFNKGDFKAPVTVFKKYVQKAGVDVKDVEIIKGYYDKALTDELKNKYDLKKAAVIHVDCDLYISTKPVLSFIGDLVDSGTILIFDDWYSFSKEKNKNKFGEERAFNEELLPRVVYGKIRRRSVFLQLH